MTSEDSNRFYDVRMPRWYRGAAWMCRIVGFLAALGGMWVFVYVAKMTSFRGFCCFFIGLVLLILPSLPKAAIEQWNRIKGLQDGSLLADLNKKKDKKP